MLSGIYCLDKSICKLVGKRKVDMPEIINKSNKMNKKIGIGYI